MPPDPKMPGAFRTSWWPFGRRREFEEHVLSHLHELRRMQMATAAELNAKVDRISTAVDNIKADIQAIKDGLPASGGMTQEEVDALDAKLADVVTKTENLDAENPAG